MSRSALSLLSAALVLTLPVADVFAQTTSVDASFLARIQQNPNGPVYRVRNGVPGFGSNFIADNDYRSYFSFDLSAIPLDAEITAATLFIGETSSGGTFGGTHQGSVESQIRLLPDGFATIANGDTGVGSPADIAFDAIGTGTLLQTFFTDFYTENQVASLVLSNDFLTALQDALGGSLAFGLKIGDEDATGTTVVFSMGVITSASARLLVDWFVPVPPPPPPPVTPGGGGSGSTASYQAQNQNRAYRHMQAQQANARRIAQQQRQAQHRRNQ